MLKKLFKKKANKPVVKSRYNSLNDLDKKIEKYLDYENGFFVELGANDGINQSNTLYFEEYKNWKGILIEPTPHKYLECKKNRSKLSKVYCAACTSFEYKEKFVEIIYSNLMSIPTNLESDIISKNEHAILGKQFLNEEEDNFIFGALARNLNEILIESDAPKIIDLLSLDVEGAEIEVLKGINHNEFRFKYIIVECRDFNKLEGFLNLNNYSFIEKMSYHDYLFKNNII